MDIAVAGKVLAPAESTEVLRARETVTTLKDKVAELTGRLALSDLAPDLLREQLSVKEKQIARQGTQVIARPRPPRRFGVSAAASNRPPERHPHLAGAAEGHEGSSAPAPEAWTVGRPPSRRVCAYELLLLSERIA